MKNILVPIDFSIKSHNALNLAKKVAGKSGGTVHIMHVLEPILGQYTSMGEFSDEELDDVYTLKLRAKLAKDIARLKEANQEAGFTITSSISIGNPYEEIKNKTEELNADLVVIGANGLTDLEEFLVGSITDKLIHHLRCPVITVKELVDDFDLQNIVFVTDTEEDQKPIIDLLVEFQQLFGSKLHIVRINTRRNFQNDIDTYVQLRQLVDQYQLRNYTITSYCHEDEEYGVVYFADEKKADLIVMGVHEKSAMKRLISGGAKADEVADHTFRPVLTYLSL